MISNSLSIWLYFHMPSDLIVVAIVCKHLSSDYTPNLSQRLVQFNHHQCEYLFQKLEVAIQRVQLYCSLEHKVESLGILQFLTRLAIDVDSFIHNCCKDEWIVASIMLSNTFE